MGPITLPLWTVVKGLLDSCQGIAGRLSSSHRDAYDDGVASIETRRRRAVRPVDRFDERRDQLAGPGQAAFIGDGGDEAEMGDREVIAFLSS